MDKNLARSAMDRFQPLLYPALSEMGRRNETAFVLVAVLAAIGGSFATLVIALFASWALISLVLRRLPFRMSPADRPVVLSSLVFFAVLAGTNAVHSGWPETLITTLKLLPFVIPLLLISRMRLTAPGKILPLIYRGAAVGGCLLLPIVVVEYGFISQYFSLTSRTAGFSGNPGPFSVTSILIAGLALFHLSRHNGLLANAMAVLGASGASLAVLLSGMRGAWPALPVVIAVALFVRRGEIVALWRQAFGWQRGLAAAVLVAGAVVVGVFSVPAIDNRIERLESDILLLETSPAAATSLNIRRNIYNAAVAAWAERPWTGYGIDREWQAIEPYLEAEAFGERRYSHLHNVFLTVGVDAGLLGLAALILVILAPLWTAWRARRHGLGADRMGVALVLVTAFLVPGLTNLMFFHDILDAVWVFMATTLCASVPTAADRAVGR